jgi:rhomboid protease GluP
VRDSQGGELALSYEWQRRLERWKSTMRGLFGGGGGGEQGPRPQLCPACGSLVGISATKCHVCGTSLRFSLAAFSKKFSGVFGEHEAPVTTALLIANILMLGISWMALVAAGGGKGLSILWGLGGATQYRLGASFPFSIFYMHEWWRVVTAMFLHGGLLHIGFNMMALLQLGPAIEELYGSARYLFIYVFAGAFGFLVSAGFGNFSLGASGALLGLVGVMLAITTKRGGSYMRELRSRLVSSVVILFAIGFMGMGIDNYAHGAGLAAGFVLGKLFADRQPANANERRRAYALGWLAGLVVLASFVLMIMHYRDPLPGESTQSLPAAGKSALFYCQYKTSAVDPHSIVVVSLHSPKEKVWGELLDINPSGVTLRGIDLNSFDHFIRQINEPDGERIGLPTIFFPMNRVERVSLDEPTGSIPSMNELFARKIGRTLTDYLSQFA